MVRVCTDLYVLATEYVPQLLKISIPIINLEINLYRLFIWYLGTANCAWLRYLSVFFTRDVLSLWYVYVPTCTFQLPSMYLSQQEHHVQIINHATQLYRQCIRYLGEAKCAWLRYLSVFFTRDVLSLWYVGTCIIRYFQL